MNIEQSEEDSQLVFVISTAYHRTEKSESVVNEERKRSNEKCAKMYSKCVFIENLESVLHGVNPSA